MTFEMKYSICHNLDARFMRGYEHGDRLVQGYQGTIEAEGRNAKELAEAIFAKHNRDDRPDGNSAPSLSVGDIVTIGGNHSYTVLNFGFLRVYGHVEDIVPGPWAEAFDRVWGARP
jgi:hypothetical protein